MYWILFRKQNYWMKFENKNNIIDKQEMVKKVVKGKVKIMLVFKYKATLSPIFF